MDRSEIIKDICTVYSYKDRKKLYKMSDDQLLAFRESLRERGKISRYLDGRFSIHVSVFLKIYGANTYIIDTEGSQTVITLGLQEEKKTHQLGQIKLDNLWKIVDVNIHGTKMKRYNGKELIIDGKK